MIRDDYEVIVKMRNVALLRWAKSSSEWSPLPFKLNQLSCCKNPSISSNGIVLGEVTPWVVEGIISSSRLILIVVTGPRGLPHKQASDDKTTQPPPCTLQQAVYHPRQKQIDASVPL